MYENLKGFQIQEGFNPCYVHYMHTYSVKWEAPSLERQIERSINKRDGILFFSISEGEKVMQTALPKLREMIEFYPGATETIIHRDNYRVFMFMFPLKPNL